MNRFLLLVFLLALGGCKTKADLQREQDVERLKAEVRASRGTRADLDVVAEQMRTEISRMTSYVEEQTLHQRRQTEELKGELAQMNSKLEAVEKRIRAIEEAAEREAEKPQQASLDVAQKHFDAERFEEASDAFRDVIRKNASAGDVKKARFMLAESQFSAKNYASSVIEFSEFKKAYPKDNRVPEATYRQAQAFRALGKKKEAQLFYQELIDRFPKSSLAAKAKQEVKRLK